MPLKSVTYQEVFIQQTGCTTVYIGSLQSSDLHSLLHKIICTEKQRGKCQATIVNQYHFVMLISNPLIHSVYVMFDF